MSPTHLKEHTVVNYTQVAVLKSGTEYGVSVWIGRWLENKSLKFQFSEALFLSL